MTGAGPYTSIPDGILVVNYMSGGWGEEAGGNNPGELIKQKHAIIIACHHHYRAGHRKSGREGMIDAGHR